jgi:hypothetical protein
MDGAAPETSKPKYAPWISLLAEDASHFRRAAAPAYWRLAPHYVGQETETSCSLASATMVVNSLRGGRAGEAMATQADVLAAVGDGVWRAGVSTDEGHGASGRLLADCLARALPLYGIATEVVHVPVPDAGEGAPRLREALAGLESGDRLIVGHFHMAAVIGEGDYGHFSPLGAFDSATDRVLVLDVYRVTFEPYWVPFERLLAGMATRDRVAGEPRGWIEVRLA